VAARVKAIQEKYANMSDKESEEWEEEIVFREKKEFDEEVS
jgi:hypothetical protein